MSEYMTTGDYALNMPEVPDAILQALYIDETWSWAGLVESLGRRYTRSDMEELSHILTTY